MLFSTFSIILRGKGKEAIITNQVRSKSAKRQSKESWHRTSYDKNLDGAALGGDSLEYYTVRGGL